MQNVKLLSYVISSSGGDCKTAGRFWSTQCSETNSHVTLVIRGHAKQEVFGDATSAGGTLQNERQLWMFGICFEKKSLTRGSWGKGRYRSELGDAKFKKTEWPGQTKSFFFSFWRSTAFLCYSCYSSGGHFESEAAARKGCSENTLGYPGMWEWADLTPWWFETCLVAF